MKEAEKRMNFENNYFILENAVTDRFCDHVLEYGKHLKEQIGMDVQRNTPYYSSGNLSSWLEF
mgnify:CR=1 FL=1